MNLSDPDFPQIKNFLFSGSTDDYWCWLNKQILS